jgi:Xaa-Pro aminopeptidase
METDTELEYFEAELEDKGYDKVLSEEGEEPQTETGYTREGTFLTVESVSGQEVTAVEFSPDPETGRNVDLEDLNEAEEDSLYSEFRYIKREFLKSENVEYIQDVEEEPFKVRVDLEGSVEEKYNEFEEAEEAVETLQDVRAFLGA